MPTFTSTISSYRKRFGNDRNAGRSGNRQYSNQVGNKVQQVAPIPLYPGRTGVTPASCVSLDYTLTESANPNPRFKECSKRTMGNGVTTPRAESLEFALIDPNNVEGFKANSKSRVWAGSSPALCETSDVPLTDSLWGGLTPAERESLTDPIKPDEFKVAQSDDKAQTQNDQLSSYIEKVRNVEQQNEGLRAELERWSVKGSSRRQDLYEHELNEIRSQVAQLTSEKARVEVHRDNLLVDMERIRGKLQEQILQREEAERSMQSFRQDVDNATLTRVNLERKVELLQQEMTFLKKLHVEEMAELQAQKHHLNLDLTKPDLTSALGNARLQYENLAAKNILESGDWYNSKFTDLAEAANRNNEALQAAKLEASEYRRQVQALTCGMDALKRTNESLERQIREMEANFTLESSGYQNTISHLEEEIRSMKDEMVRSLREYQELLSIKLALDIEVATYRKLLEGEESRILASLPNFAALSLRDPVLDSRPVVQSPTSRKAHKIIENKNGKVINGNSKKHEDLQ